MFFVCGLVGKQQLCTGPMPVVDAVLVAGAMVACGTPASIAPWALWPGTIDGRLNDVAGGILSRLAKESAGERVGGGEAEAAAAGFGVECADAGDVFELI